MKYLDRFILMDENANSGLVEVFTQDHDDDEYFPLGFFSSRLTRLDFEEITILYGGNGSGKSTLLSLIAKKARLRVQRERDWTKGFWFYLENCSLKYTTSGRRSVLLRSKILTSEDIFETLLTKREENSFIGKLKQDEGKYYRRMRSLGEDQRQRYQLRSLDDYERFKKYNETRRKSQVAFIRQRAGRKSREYSNGEQALRFFDEEIEENAVYLLDEPENSMSPVFQLELKNLIEDCARFFNCQFIIATHSPFILSLDSVVTRLPIF